MLPGVGDFTSLEVGLSSRIKKDFCRAVAAPSGEDDT